MVGLNSYNISYICTYLYGILKNFCMDEFNRLWSPLMFVLNVLSDFCNEVLYVTGF